MNRARGEDPVQLLLLVPPHLPPQPERKLSKLEHPFLEPPASDHEPDVHIMPELIPSPGLLRLAAQVDVFNRTLFALVALGEGCVPAPAHEVLLVADADRAR